MAAGLRRATGILGLGLPALSALPRPYRGKGSPHVGCSLHLSHLNYKAPASTQLRAGADPSSFREAGRPTGTGSPPGRFRRQEAGC